MSLTEAWTLPHPAALSIDPTGVSTSSDCGTIAVSSALSACLSSSCLTSSSSSTTPPPPPSTVSPPLSPLSSVEAKMPASTSSLPNPRELSKEDDWTRVKDPKEKKRIQNRVAQRTYRHRMKARLGELQARLDSHERRRFQQASPPDSDSSTSSGGGVGPFGVAPGSAGLPGHHSPAHGGRASESSPSPDRGPIPTPTPGDSRQHHHQQMPMLGQPGLFEQPPMTDESEAPPVYSQALGYLHSPPHSHPSPPPPSQGLLSPPGPGPAGAEQRSAKVSPDFVLDCLRFQTQLLNRLNSLQQDETAGYSGPPPYGALDAMAPNSLSQAEAIGCVGSFTPTQTDGMDFAFDDAVDVCWKAEPLDAQHHKMRQPSPSAEAMGFPSLSAAPPHVLPSVLEAGAGSGNPDMGSVPPMSTRGASPSLDQRFENIMQHVEAAGFASFDDLVTAYYSDTFGEASPLAHEQHLSRNRRLPLVIGDVFRASAGWTHWERRGFHEEVLKTAESMLISEASSVHGRLLAQVRPLIEPQDGNVPADALLGIKKSIQNELPNSWALTMALAADNRASWQRDRSNTALATTLLLQCAGRIPNSQLLQLIGACL